MNYMNNFKTTSTNVIFALVCILVAINTIESKPFSKYGRTCQDIGCANNEVCVIAEDPCTFGSRECGRYPTCKEPQRSCDSLACGFNEECRVNDGEARCVPLNVRSSSTNNYNQAGYPSTTGSSLYPGGTTSRPYNTNYNQNSGGGYSGGQIGSGFPGSYPNQGNVQSTYRGVNNAAAPGAPGSSNYPVQQNPGGIYPSLGQPNSYYPNYPGYNPAFPNNGYNQGQYPGQYPNQGQYNQGYPNGGYSNGGYLGNNQGYGAYPNQGTNKGSSLFSLDNLLKAGKVAAGVYNSLKPANPGPGSSPNPAH